MPEGDADILLSMHGVTKHYPARRGWEQFVHAVTSGTRGGVVTALDNISFQLVRGDALGVVGRNGAGKSTLLQLACGTLRPSSGQVERTGRFAAMLELGAGFKREFTGRENVYLNASIYGLSDAEIDDRFEQIAEFAAIGDFMDRPVAEYSSGMFMRLAFAVCAHVDADVLIVDEVLAVGDAAFQAKCRRFMERFLERGAILFVSHDEHLVLSVCNRAIWIENGKAIAAGVPEDVLVSYRQGVEAGDDLQGELAQSHGTGTRRGRRLPAIEDPQKGKNPIAVSPFRTEAAAHGDGGAVIDDVYFADSEGRPLETVHGGTKVDLVIAGRAMRDLERPIAGFIFRDGSGQNLFGDNTYLQYRTTPVAMTEGDRFRATLSFDLPLLPHGRYSIAPSIIEGTQQNHIHLFWMEEAVLLTVLHSPVSMGKIGVPTAVQTRVT